MNPANDARSRLEELYIAEHLFGLSAEEMDELHELKLKLGPGDLASFRELIAKLDRVRSEEDFAKLPEGVRSRVHSQIAGTTGLRGPGKAKLPMARMAWYATAACVLVACTALITTAVLRRGAQVARSASELRKELIAAAPEAIQINWSDGPTPVPGAKGDVVWSNRDQKGFMRFQDMKANDPAIEQYQLWIFDRNQDEKTPIDGGVFNIGIDGETVVPIRAALTVRQPYLFAVTIEKPGGVVVSDRKRLPLLASVKQ